MQQTANDVDQVKRLSSPNLIIPDHGVLPILSGNQLRDSIHHWLSPPDPSTNHNIACGTHHKKMATWFFESSIFQEWKSSGSLLWIHRKRWSCPLSGLTPSDSPSCILAGSGKSVTWFVNYKWFLSEETDVPYQLHSGPKYRNSMRGRKCVDGIFLF